jgi:hypothetical protein
MNTKTMLRCILYVGWTILSFNTIYGQNSRTEDLIKKLSKDKFEFMNAEKVDKLIPMLDDRLVFIHSNGMTESKTEMISNLKNNKWSIEKVKLIGNPTVRVIKNDVAVLIGKGNYLVNTADKKVDINLYYTEVWVHYKRGWLLFSRHATRIE